MLPEEGERALVELIVDGGVSATFEDHYFGGPDPALKRAAKRVDVTMSIRPKVISVGASILASCADASCPMTAADWRMNRPSWHWTSMHERCKGLHIVLPRSAELGCEAPCEDPGDHHLGDAVESSRHDPPAFHDNLQEQIGPVPRALQR